MSDESNNEGSFEKKVTIWLGIAASVIGVLGFFGISSWNDLRNAVNPADIACHQALDAVNDANKSKLAPAERHQILYQQLLKAAEATEDLTLQRLIEAYAEKGGQEELDGWWEYCKKEGVL
ncbi:hypothetical protein [Kitasatospora sp. NPDC059599]|uniref:hypothetical protein n=1 Tax=Kitasatospora sp. NPDC059599 TaxID=3346880 RepID=UPI0036ADF93B